jgi:predicted NBD/HSP70 family sugar kinase
MQIASVGIDLGKTTFHFVVLDDHGKIFSEPADRAAPRPGPPRDNTSDRVPAA